jgi:hypothetical protein
MNGGHGSARRGGGSPTARRRRAAALALACAVLTGCADPQAEAGRRLFVGETALPARLGERGDPLPVQASRCINCHGGERPAAPPLTGAHLTQARPRLNGPAVAYDRDSFCRALVQGITPNHITLAPTMPRYQADAAACAALWAYVVSREPR